MKKILIPFLLGIILLVGCGNSEEKKARETAESYMDAVKSGDEYNAIEPLIEGFIDVLNYEYLKTLDDKKEKDIRELTYNNWKSLYGNNSNSLYPTFEDYKDAELETIAMLNDDNKSNYEIIQNNEYTLEYWDGESYINKYTFLYNVEITNEEGQKIYKKSEITVKDGLVYNEKKDDYEKGYIISDITLR